MPSRRPLLRALVPAALLAAALAAAPVAGAADEKRDAHPVPAAPSPGERAARIALHAVGVPYRYGGDSPAGGFDCSGLVRWAYGQVGIELPHSSYALYDLGRRVPPSRLEPGDVLFFEGLGHVGLYLGSGRMVHAPQSGRRVEVQRLSGWYAERLVGARRLIPA
jgi:cell wall-associated NlpC family hydrolase